MENVELYLEDWQTKDGETPVATTDKYGRYSFSNLSNKKGRQVIIVANKEGYKESRTSVWLGDNRHPITLKPKGNN
jgi:hypothetical protein